MHLSLVSWLVVAAELASVTAKVPRVSHPKSKQAAHLRNKRPGSKKDPSSFTGAGWSARAPGVDAPKANVWDALTNDEAAAVIGFLHNQTTLNLTVAENATRYACSLMLFASLGGPA